MRGNSLLRMVIIDTVINTLLGRLTLDPVSMHCPAWDDAFVSSPFQAFADSSRGKIIVERHVQCPQSPMHLVESVALSGSSWLHSSMNFGSRN